MPTSAPKNICRCENNNNEIDYHKNGKNENDSRSDNDKENNREDDKINKANGG